MGRSSCELAACNQVNTPHLIQQPFQASGEVWYEMVREFVFGLSALGCRIFSGDAVKDVDTVLVV